MPARPAPLALLALLACAPAGPAGEDASSSAPDGATTSGAASTSAATASTTATGEADAAGTTADDPAPTSTGDDPSTGGDACGAAGSVDDCCCFGVAGDRGHGTLAVDCPAPAALCPTPQATCPEGQVACGPDALEVTTPDELACALAALAAGEPGLVQWSVASGDGLGGANGHLYLLGDGTALAYDLEYHELEYSYGDVALRELPAPGFFADCAAAEAAGERFDCLRQATAGAPLELCVAGFAGTAGRE
jgi:hypothetical protein